MPTTPPVVHLAAPPGLGHTRASDVQAATASHSWPMQPTGLAGEAMWGRLLSEGGAKAWLLNMRRTRRRFGPRQLIAVWDSAIRIDDMLWGQEPHRAKGLLRHDALLELDPRWLASRRHLHDTGDVQAAARMLFNPPPGMDLSLLPPWFLKSARRGLGRRKRRGLIEAHDMARCNGGFDFSKSRAESAWCCGPFYAHRRRSDLGSADSHWNGVAVCSPPR